MEIEQNIWGFTDEGEVALLYTMRNASGAEVRLTNVGASIVGVTVPDRNGQMTDVALGYGDFRAYFHDSATMGKTVGRYAGRIARGRFTLDGTEHFLAQNSPPNHLHGGVNGLGNRLWQARVETDRVVFSYTSPDGEEGYPGELGLEVVYDWDDDCELEITYYARGSAATIVNLTNHAYFNLAGGGGVLNHELKLYASHYLPLDATLIPTGEIAPVEGTPMDFTRAKPLGRDIDADSEQLRIAYGYDHCWAADGWMREGELDTRLREVAQLTNPVSGRKLTVRSTQLGVQVYTGNFLQGCPPSKSGRRYENHDGVAIQCQGFPDAPNHPGFPSRRLDAGEVYNEKIVYSFKTV